MPIQLKSRCLPPDEPVDLMNVAFAQPRKPVREGVPHVESWMTPDRISGLDAWRELKKACPREWRFVKINVTFEVRTPLGLLS